MEPKVSVRNGIFLEIGGQFLGIVLACSIGRHLRGLDASHGPILEIFTVNRKNLRVSTEEIKGLGSLDRFLGVRQVDVLGEVGSNRFFRFGQKGLHALQLGFLLVQFLGGGLGGSLCRLGLLLELGYWRRRLTNGGNLFLQIGDFGQGLLSRLVLLGRFLEQFIFLLFHSFLILLDLSQGHFLKLGGVILLHHVDHLLDRLIRPHLQNDQQNDQDAHHRGHGVEERVEAHVILSFSLFHQDRSGRPEHAEVDLPFSVQGDLSILAHALSTGLTGNGP